MLLGAAALSTRAETVRAQARAGVEQTVVVEEIRVVGNTVLSDAVLKAALDVPVGKALSREALDDAMRIGKQRLEALGYFRSVDLALQKGRSRGRFRLVVTVQAERSSYFGATTVRSENKENAFRGPLRRKESISQAYAGSRNLAGTGLRGEFALVYSETDMQSDVIESFQSMPGFSASLYDPSLADSPWFAGVATAMLFSRSRTTFDIPELPEPSRTKSKGRFGFGYGLVGRRIGLTTASVGVSRFISRFESESEGEVTVTSVPPATGILGRFTFSDKTFLTKVEPGTALSIDYNRDTAPHYQPPTVGITALHTWMPAGAHALTPILAGQYEYSTYGEDVALDRAYDCSLKYDFVATANLTLELGYGEYRRVDVDDQDDPYRESYPQRRKRVAVFYTSSSFLLSVAFQYGENGLDRDTDQLFLPNSDRFTQ